MKKSRSFWNYIDLLLQAGIILAVIAGVYYLAEYLERYIYRYTVFPLVAFVFIFILGILLGRGVERTKKNKPIGLISKAMAESRKKKNRFIFSDAPNSYSPHKEIIEEIKSGDIVHVKHFEDSEFNIDEFYDLYKVQIENIVDDKMGENDKENNE